jgi:hypothetical protein
VKLVQVIVPVRPKAQGVPNKGAHDGTGSTVLNGSVGHALILLVVKLYFSTK